MENKPELNLEVFKEQFLLLLEWRHIECVAFINGVKEAKTISELWQHFGKYADEIAEEVGGSFSCKECDEEGIDKRLFISDYLRTNLFFQMKLRCFMENFNNFSFDELESMLQQKQAS